MIVTRIRIRAACAEGKQKSRGKKTFSFFEEAKEEVMRERLAKGTEGGREDKRTDKRSARSAASHRAVRDAAWRAQQCQESSDAPASNSHCVVAECDKRFASQDSDGGRRSKQTAMASA